MSPRAGDQDPGDAALGARSGVGARLPRLPLVGREPELSALKLDLARSRAGKSAFLVIHGEPGVGKSRLLSVVAEEARRSGWTVAPGRAFALETGVPYALLSDALVPLLREMEPARLSLLTRGSEARLAQLFPALRSLGRGGAADPSGAADRSELFWTFA